MRAPVVILIFSLLPGFAPGQVIIHQAALDQLAGIVPPVAAPPLPAPAPQLPAVHRIIHHKPTVIAAKPQFAPVAMKPVPAVAMPRAPILGASMQPAPAAAKPPPPTPVVIDFAAGSATLPANAKSALQPVCRAASAGPIGIDAYAPADPADPSSAMRLSLGRAFAVRDALTACGIQAARIVPRANGAANAQNTGIALITVGGAAP